MACRQSGLSDSRWCKENHIHPSSLYYWIDKLRAEAPEIVERKKEVSAPYHQDVVPLHVSSLQNNDLVHKQHEQTASSTAIILQVGTLSLEIQNGATEDTIRNTLQALKFLC